MNNTEYESPEWQKKRLEVMSTADFVCQSCGTKGKQLHVHHKKYEKDRKVWEYPNENLICLCSECHQEIHDLTHEFQSYISSFSFPAREIRTNWFCLLGDLNYLSIHARNEERSFVESMRNAIQPFLNRISIFALLDKITALKNKLESIGSSIKND